MTNDPRSALLYQAQAKSAGTAYLLWFFLGTLGIHRFYCGKVLGTLVLYALGAFGAFCLVGGAAAGMGEAVLLGWLSLMAFGFWLIVDLFRIGGWVRASNLRLANKLAPERKARPRPLTPEQETAERRRRAQWRGATLALCIVGGALIVGAIVAGSNGSLLQLIAGN